MKKEFIPITPDTEVKVGDEIMGIANELFAEIVKIVDNTYYIQFAIDYADERPIQRSRKKLENYYLIYK